MITQSPPIRVLVVDDSTFMRNTLSTMLMKYPDVQVVGTAKTGREALSQVAKLAPDVMTLDVDMPEMNGLEVLDRVMVDHPIPIVMVSSLTHEGAEETFQALARGAFDYIPKQQRVSPGDLGALETRLYEKIKSAFDNKTRFLQSLEKTVTGSGKSSLVKLASFTPKHFRKDLRSPCGTSNDNEVNSHQSHSIRDVTPPHIESAICHSGA